MEFGGEVTLSIPRKMMHGPKMPVLVCMYLKTDSMDLRVESVALSMASMLVDFLRRLPEVRWDPVSERADGDGLIGLLVGPG